MNWNRIGFILLIVGLVLVNISYIGFFMLTIILLMLESNSIDMIDMFWFGYGFVSIITGPVAVILAHQLGKRGVKK